MIEVVEDNFSCHSESVETSFFLRIMPLLEKHGLGVVVSSLQP